MCLFELTFSSFQDTCPEVGFLDHMVALFLGFLRKLPTVLQVAVPIYIPTNSVEGLVLKGIILKGGIIDMFKFSLFLFPINKMLCLYLDSIKDREHLPWGVDCYVFYLHFICI